MSKVAYRAKRLNAVTKLRVSNHERKRLFGALEVEHSDNMDSTELTVAMLYERIGTLEQVLLSMVSDNSYRSRVDQYFGLACTDRRPLLEQIARVQALIADISSSGAFVLREDAFPLKAGEDVLTYISMGMADIQSVLSYRFATFGPIGICNSSRQILSKADSKSRQTN